MPYRFLLGILSLSASIEAQGGTIEIINQCKGDLTVSVLNRDPLSLHSVLLTRKIKANEPSSVLLIKEKQLAGASVRGIQGDRYFLIKGVIDHKPISGVCGLLDVHLNYRIYFKSHLIGTKCISIPNRAS
jgi:hypothetical protein